MDSDAPKLPFCSFSVHYQHPDCETTEDGAEVSDDANMVQGESFIDVQLACTVCRPCCSVKVMDGLQSFPAVSD